MNVHNSAMSSRVDVLPVDRLRPWRYLWRLPLLLLSVVLAVLLAGFLLNDLVARIRIGGLRWDHRAIRWWAAQFLRVFGVRVRQFGAPLPGGTLFVANHVNWLDIVVLHSRHMMGFVAKAEIARWPLIGWLATRGETIYHHRGNADSMRGVMHQMARRLAAGRAVAVFPEGRTTDGRVLGVFHARIFAPAQVAGAPIQPVALRYGERGCAQSRIAFAPGEHFIGNLWRLLGEPARVAEVHFLAPIAPDAGSRRELAKQARAAIDAVMAS